MQFINQISKTRKGQKRAPHSWNKNPTKQQIPAKGRQLLPETLAAWSA